MIYEKWGQQITQISASNPEVWELRIGRARLREGEPPRVGVNLPICEYLYRRRANLLVKIDEPKAEMYIGMDTPTKKLKKEKVKSKFENGKPMVLCLFRIPIFAKLKK